MQTVQWITFGLAQNLAQTSLHLVPAAAGISAPYPVVTRVSCFRGGECQKSLTVEGLRLQQPDCIVVDELFPFLKEQPVGFYGIEITLGCAQPRVDLSRSSCFMEIRHKSTVLQFRPAITGKAESNGSTEKSTGLVIKDSYLNSSIVFVNGTEQQFSPALIQGDVDSTHSVFTVEAVAPLSVLEIPAKEGSVERLKARQFGWGMSRMTSVTLSEQLPSGAGCYLMYRDAVSQFPISVRQL